MKNYKKVLDELRSVSLDFYVGGSLSLYVFHYITRTPRDLDIQSTDPAFLKVAKEMQELYPVPVDLRGGWDNTKQARIRRQGERFSPETITPEQEEKRAWLAKLRKKPERHAVFLLHGVKVEVFNNKVEKYHLVHTHKFIDPNEVLFYKYQYQYLKREKDIRDEAEAWSLLYPEKVLKHGDRVPYYEGCLFNEQDFKMKVAKYAGNNLPTSIVEKVLAGKLKARSLSGHDKEAKKARENRIEFMRMFNASKKPIEIPPFDRYLSDEPQRINANTFKLYGYPLLHPSVKLCSRFVFITNEWEHKFKISKKTFEALRQGIEKGPITVRYYPKVISLKNGQGKKINLEHKTFQMLKTINYSMIA